MAETSFSLLDRLRHNPEEAAWQRMVDLYSPLIRGWLRRYTLADDDVNAERTGRQQGHPPELPAAQDAQRPHRRDANSLSLWERRLRRRLANSDCFGMISVCSR